MHSYQITGWNGRQENLWHDTGGFHSTMEVNVRILHSVADLKRCQGGMTFVVPGICEALSDQGADVTILFQRDASSSLSEYHLPDCHKVQIHWVPQISVMGRQFPSLSFYDAVKFLCRSRDIHIIHDHGIWLPSNHIAGRCAYSFGIPLVVHPHGMLEPWALSYRAWKKKLAWKLYQHRDLQRAALLIATSRQEAAAIRKTGLRQPIAIIPNGVDMPRWEPPAGRPEPVRTALFLSRVHPKKGLLNLVTAWAAVQPEGWRVVVAGPDENGHLQEVTAAVQKAGLEHCFRFAGAVAGAAKADMYRNADLFILPTFSENFGLVVAEALSYGIPVITTRGAPWEALMTHGCGWWVDTGAEPLTAAIREATTMNDASRREMGARGRRYVEAAFSWPHIAEEMLAAYQWVLGQGPKPGNVIDNV